MRTLCSCTTALLCGVLLSLGCFQVASVAPPATRAVAKPSEAVAETTKDSAPSEKAAEPWGTLKGRVTWGDKLPFTPEELAGPKALPACLPCCPIASENFVVGKDGGVANVFVWLTDASDPTAKLPIHPSLKAIKDKEVVIDQPCCKFEPHAVALREGQVLVGKNSSPIAHNMKWTGGDDNPGDNKLIPAGGKIEIDDLKASKSPVVVECNIHAWMRAWVRVFGHPYFAVTGADGKFEIKDAPTGKYNVVMWQDGKGWVNGGKAGQPVEIKAGGTTEVNGQVRLSEE